MQNKRILVISHTGRTNGATISLVDLIESLKAEGNVTLMTPKLRGSIASDSRLKDVSIHQVPLRFGQWPEYSGGPSPVSFRFAALSILAILQILPIYFFLKKNSPSVIILNSGVLCWILPFAGRMTKVCILRETEHDRISLSNKIRSFLLKYSDVLGYISQYDMDVSEVHSTKSILVRDGVSFPATQILNDKNAIRMKMGIESTAFAILFVGGINPIKGIDFLLHYLGKVDFDMTVIIAGPGSDALGDLGTRGKSKRVRYLKGKLRTLARFRPNIVVKIIGDRESLGQIYSACDILVMTMPVPHQARPMFEAGIYSRTFVAPDFVQYRESASSMVNCLLYEPGNISSFGASLERARSEPRLLEKLGKENALIAAELHSLGTCYQELQKVVAEAL